MAHFAQLNNNNVVMQVIVVDNNDAVTEQDGIDYIKNVLKIEGTWVQTSYNNNIRGKFAAVTDIYDTKKNEFVINTKYWEEQEKLNLEQEQKLKTELAKKETIAAKIGLTVEELQAILRS
jgi:hypothetical protein